jgi:predicted Zn-dependent protease
MMGSGSFWARVGAGLWLVGSLGLVACQPLYGGKPDKLVAPAKKSRPKEADVPAEAQYKDIDDCKADFHGEPKTVRQQPEQARQLTTEGDTALSNADHATDPSAQGGLLKEAVERYRNALLKDPYSAEATLKLALAYDRVYRKGCAIAMLKRLSSLTANPKFARSASAAIDSIGDNSQWFRRYRKDADAAVGR